MPWISNRVGMALLTISVLGGILYSVDRLTAESEPSSRSSIRAASDADLARLYGRQAPPPCVDKRRFWECHSGTQECVHGWSPPPLSTEVPCPTTATLNCLGDYPGYKCTTECQNCYEYVEGPHTNDICVQTPLEIDVCLFDIYRPCLKVKENGSCITKLIDVLCQCLCLDWTESDYGLWCECQDPT